MADEQTPQTDDGTKVSPLRTFQSDVADVIQSGQGSLTKIAVAENERRIRTGNFAADGGDGNAPVHTRLIVGISVGLVVIGTVSLAIIYFARGGSTAPQTSTAPRPIITTDADKKIDLGGLTRERLITRLVKERDSGGLTLSSVTGITFTEGNATGAQAVSAKTFLEKLQSHAPSELIRSLDDNFLFGLHALNTTEPFLILKTGYYQSAFAGMLGWEKDLEDDLGGIFIRPETLPAASTSDELLNRTQTFQDIVVKNRDTRALRDASGKIIFLYSFPDKSSIVITTNADTLEEIASRLIKGKLTR